MSAANNNYGLKIFGIISSSLCLLFFIIVILGIGIYLYRKNNSNSSNDSNSNNSDSNNGGIDIISVNNSTSNGIKDLTTTFIVEGSKLSINGFFSDNSMLDTINSSISSLNIKLTKKAINSTINYEYTIDYPDNTIKYITSNTDQIKYLLLLGLPNGTKITETGISGTGIISKYVVNSSNTSLVTTIKEIFL